MDAAGLEQLTPQQRQAVMQQAQQEANQQIMQQMMEKMTEACFKKCAGTSVSTVPYCVPKGLTNTLSLDMLVLSFSKTHFGLILRVFLALFF